MKEDLKKEEGGKKDNLKKNSTLIGCDIIVN
jgi:hypothetical protein